MPTVATADGPIRPDFHSVASPNIVRRVTAAHTSPGQAPLGLFTGPADRADAVAVVTDEGEFTYFTLARMCAERAAE